MGKFLDGVFAVLLILFVLWLCGYWKDTSPPATPAAPAIEVFEGVDRP